MATLGKYELQEEVGRGGFAVVYRARDPDLKRDVAVKILLPHRSWNPAFAQRFRNEAQAMAGLRHRNIVYVHEVGEDEEQLYIAMEFLPGRTLAQVLEDEPDLQTADVLDILEQIASALDYAHAEGALHRDVKPSNIMIEQTRQGELRAILMDFGLVKVMASEESITSTGTILGSPAYMAPEQADFERADEIGPATDIYALGIVAYEMLTGQVPFSGSTAATLVAHVLKEPPDPLTIRDDLPPAVSEVLLKTLSKDGRDRYSSAGEMVQALRQSIEAGEEDRLREEQLAALYGQIQAAIKAGDWDIAEARSREILALDPSYRDMPEVWIQVTNGKARQAKLQERYKAAEAALARGAWAEALALCRQIQEEQPGYRPVDSLLARAEEELRKEQAEEELQAQLTALYWQAQQAEKKEEWAEVVRLGGEIETLQPGYRDVAGLVERARGRLSQAEAQEAQKARLTALYSRAQAASRAKDWAQVRLLCAEIEDLEPGSKKVRRLAAKAEKELAKQVAAEEPVSLIPEPESGDEPPATAPKKKRRRIRGRVLVVIGVIAVCLIVSCLAGLAIDNAAKEKARATSWARALATRNANATATEAALGVAAAGAEADATESARRTATAEAEVTAAVAAQRTDSAESRATATRLAQRTETAEAQAAAGRAAGGTAAAEALTASAKGVERTATAEARTATAEAAASDDAPELVPEGYVAIIQETFDDNLLLWELGEEQDEWGTRSKSIGDGVYRVEVESSRAALYRQLPKAQNLSSDFYLSVEGRLLSGPSTASYGLVFRNRQDSYYTFLAEDWGRVVVPAMVDGEWVERPVDWMSTEAIVVGETNRLTVIATASFLTFYVNDQLVTAATDSALTEGYVGIAVNVNEEGSAVFEFDNFQLYVPSWSIEDG